MTTKAKTDIPKPSTDVVVELCNCKAGEQIHVALDRQAYARLYSFRSYMAYRTNRRAPVVCNSGRQIDATHYEYTITSDGDWFLVVESRTDGGLVGVGEPRTDGRLLPKVTVERSPNDPILWNDSHKDEKIVRKQPTPDSAPMASTINYWERKVGHAFPSLYVCRVCHSLLVREEARCAFISIIGELPRQDYVIPVCLHCYEHADGHTFIAPTKDFA